MLFRVNNASRKKEEESNDKGVCSSLYEDHMQCVALRFRQSTFDMVLVATVCNQDQDLNPTLIAAEVLLEQWGTPLRLVQQL